VSLDFDATLDGIDSVKRELLNRLVAEKAFSEPVVTSFTMSGISRAYAGILASSNFSTP
jgi:hypothetical protein